MLFNDHSNLSGSHAFLGASKFSWLNYDEDHLVEAYDRYNAAALGTALHEHAANCIRFGTKLMHSKKTLNRYVNDGIGFRMTPEQVLYYSEYCYGTADTISFRDGTLRIHDLKTGMTPAHIEQLLVYAAIFCLEYKQDPYKICIILRIYQFDDFTEYQPDPEEIKEIMEKIIRFDSILKKRAQAERNRNV